MPVVLAIGPAGFMDIVPIPPPIGPIRPADISEGIPGIPIGIPGSPVPPIFIPSWVSSLKNCEERLGELYPRRDWRLDGVWATEPGCKSAGDVVGQFWRECIEKLRSR